MTRKTMATEDPPASPEERIARLEEENELLRAENEKLRQERDTAAQAVKGAGGIAARMLLGRRLRTSFREWLKVKTLRDPLPADETADVLAAIVRRVIRVGIVGLIAAALPGIFLLWQNILLQRRSASKPLTPSSSAGLSCWRRSTRRSARRLRNRLPNLPQLAKRPTKRPPPSPPREHRIRSAVRKPLHERGEKRRSRSSRSNGGER